MAKHCNYEWITPRRPWWALWKPSQLHFCELEIGHDPEFDGPHRCLCGAQHG